jgi:hypothetical protein
MNRALTRAIHCLHSSASAQRGDAWENGSGFPARGKRDY